MAATLVGRFDWDGATDDEGHRTYNISWLMETSDVDDGPYSVMTSVDLPSPGSTWAFGNDNDPWATCYPTMTVTPLVRGEACNLFMATQIFSTKPLRRCATDTVESPLLAPYDMSGTFTKERREALWDRDGALIMTSSLELVRGAAVEREYGYPTVKIGFNSATLPLGVFAPMVDMINDAPLWGLPAKCVRLANATYERKLYGTCSIYYRIGYDFAIDYEGFDKYFPDYGHMVRMAGGTIGNPAHYVRYKDKRGENSAVLLNGYGCPLGEGQPTVLLPAKKYPIGNLLSLGIPATLA
jgi:hypothetical protein